MDDFSKAAFDASDENSKAALSESLARELAEAIRHGDDFHRAVVSSISRLKALGHDLWNYDEEDDWEVWGPDYGTPKGPGILITFERDSVRVAWTAAFKPKGSVTDEG
ncbi:MAG: hypothetical protein ABI678_03455 [Kofleriaceae bacterium]